jgi:hypothetical protein
MVSPQTRLRVSPSSKATSAAISRVQRLESLPNSLGERCSNSLTASALFWSKTARVLLGREEPATRASQTSLVEVVDGASRTVCCPQPRFSAICGTGSPLELGQKHLATPQGESVFGAQSSFELLAFVV